MDNKDSFGIGLLESGEAIKRGLASLIGNIGKTTAVITLIIASLVTFTDIGFYELGAASITSTAIMLLIASYLMYFSLEEAGERLGEESEAFTASEERYKAALAKIKPEDIGALREFCVKYSECELEFRRKSKIMSAALTYEDYLKYERGEELPHKAKKRLRKISKIKPIAIAPEVLLERDRTRNKSELVNPERGKLIRLAIKLIPTTVCTLFTATVMLGAKDGLSFVSVIEGLLKLSALPIIGFKGYAQGYGYAKGARRAWIDTKTRLLEAFLAG